MATIEKSKTVREVLTALIDRYGDYILWNGDMSVSTEFMEPGPIDTSVQISMSMDIRMAKREDK